MNNCVFCDFKALSPNVITTIRGLNAVATLGQITDGGYLLLVPFSHIECMAKFSRDHIEILGKVSREVQGAISEEYGGGVTLFEHGIVGQTIKHAHLHLIPASIDMTERIISDFPHCDIHELKDFQQLRKLYCVYQSPYLFWSRPDGRYMVCWNPSAPDMYLRLLATELLGVPERGNWRDMDPILDKKLREDTQERLIPYFIP